MTKDEEIARGAPTTRLSGSLIGQQPRSIHHIPGMADNIISKYPRLGGPDWQVIHGDSRMNPEGGYLEFYPPEERWNPIPGKPTISVFDKTLTPSQTQRMVFGDMLHHLPSVDPEFRAMRDQFRGTITPEQDAIDRGAYQRGVERYGEDRPYDKWMDVSRLDAYLRGHLAPDDNNEWAGSYTPKQLEILGNMKDLLWQPPAKGLLND